MIITLKKGASDAQVENLKALLRTKNIEPRDVAWHDIRLPGWYKDRGLAGFRGEITMRKTVFLCDITTSFLLHPSIFLWMRPGGSCMNIMITLRFFLSYILLQSFISYSCS